MDSINNAKDPNVVPFKAADESPDISMTSLRQNLVEMRKQARLHDREALSACLTLAISLAKATPKS